jgi:hypothetical protein
MSEQTNNLPSRERIARGYEPSDLRPKWLALFLVGFVLVAIVSHVTLWAVMKRLANKPRSVDVERSALSARPSTREPALQPSLTHDRPPEQDLRALRQQEDDVFAQLGWSRDAQSGAFVPPASIVQAIAQRATTQPATTQAGGAR